jgi:hypothetical protein
LTATTASRSSFTGSIGAAILRSCRVIMDITCLFVSSSSV